MPQPKLQLCIPSTRSCRTAGRAAGSRGCEAARVVLLGKDHERERAEKERRLLRRGAPRPAGVRGDDARGLRGVPGPSHPAPGTTCAAAVGPRRVNNPFTHVKPCRRDFVGNLCCQRLNLTQGAQVDTSGARPCSSCCSAARVRRNEPLPSQSGVISAPSPWPRSRCRGQRAGMVPSAALKPASSLTPWREDEEERVRTLSLDGVDESCFLSTH